MDEQEEAWNEQEEAWDEAPPSAATDSKKPEETEREAKIRARMAKIRAETQTGTSVTAAARGVKRKADAPTELEEGEVDEWVEEEAEPEAFEEDADEVEAAEIDADAEVVEETGEEVADQALEQEFAELFGELADRLTNVEMDCERAAKMTDPIVEQLKVDPTAVHASAVREAAAEVRIAQNSLGPIVKLIADRLSELEGGLQQKMSQLQSRAEVAQEVLDRATEICAAAQSHAPLLPPKSKNNKETDGIFHTNTEKTADEWAQDQTKFTGPPLPAGWIRCMSKSDGRVYYYNMETGKSSFQMPEHVKTAADWANEQAQFEGPPLPPGWIRAKSKSGKIYFYNMETSKSSFEFPEWPLPKGWTKNVSKSTGKTYFFHAQSQTSQFERPKATSEA